MPASMAGPRGERAGSEGSGNEGYARLESGRPCQCAGGVCGEKGGKSPLASPKIGKAPAVTDHDKARAALRTLLGAGVSMAKPRFRGARPVACPS